MKQIIVYQENSVPLYIEDNDGSKIEEFARTLASLLETNNVSILHTSQSSVIVRPNKISSIVINEVNIKSDNQDPMLEKNKLELQEDIIKD